MYTNIYVGVKPGEDAEVLVQAAIGVLADGGNATLCSIVTATNKEIGPGYLRQVEGALAACTERLESPGREATWSYEVDVSAIPAGVELASRAERADADLIVIGHLRRSRVGKALLGSDAQSVLLRAVAPVLCLRTD